jgi:predicted DNA-binding transcriptional regulator AlpA
MLDIQLLREGERLGITILECARLTGRSPHTIRRYIKKGEFPVERLGGKHLIPAWFIQQRFGSVDRAGLEVGEA